MQSLTHSVNHSDLHIPGVTSCEVHKNFIPGRIREYCNRPALFLVFNPYVPANLNIVDHEDEDVVGDTLDPYIGCLVSECAKAERFFSPYRGSRFSPSIIDNDKIVGVDPCCGDTYIKLFQTVLVRVRLHP